MTTSHLACLRGGGLVVAVPEDRRVRDEPAGSHHGMTLSELLGLVLAVDPGCICIGDVDSEVVGR